MSRKAIYYKMRFSFLFHYLLFHKELHFHKKIIIQDSFIALIMI